MIEQKIFKCQYISQSSIGEACVILCAWWSTPSTLRQLTVPPWPSFPAFTECQCQAEVRSESSGPSQFFPVHAHSPGHVRTQTLGIFHFLAFPFKFFDKPFPCLPWATTILNNCLTFFGFYFLFHLSQWRGCLHWVSSRSVQIKTALQVGWSLPENQLVS